MSASSLTPATAGLLDAEAFALDVVREIAATDDYLSDLERRLIAVEHALTSRRAARRLRRAIRRSTARYAWAGPSFYARRLEDTGIEWQCRDNRAGRAA